KRFAEADAKQAPPKNHVLFIGSSSIRMWKLDQTFPGKAYINRGFGGSEIVDSTHFAEQIMFPYTPRKIFLYAGDNDVSKGRSAEGVLEDYQVFVKKVHSKLPETQIIYLPIKPSLARWNLWPEMKQANQLIATFAAENDRLAYADTVTPMLGDDGKPKSEYFLKDGLHMNDAGYAAWVKVVKPFLDRD
ncbi:MAG: lysophospholipase L1-like esterase, partial [Verrucomicrobiales bacterium]